MKLLATTFLLLYGVNSMRQQLDILENEKIEVMISSQDLEIEDIKIVLSEGMGWNNTIFTILENGELLDPTLLYKPGIFNLTIAYSDSLIYNEILLYREDPKNEKLRFDFYKEGKRVFCQINSDYALEMNKEIVLNPLTPDQAKLKELLNEKIKK